MLKCLLLTFILTSLYQINMASLGFKEFSALTLSNAPGILEITSAISTVCKEITDKYPVRFIMFPALDKSFFLTYLQSIPSFLSLACTPYIFSHAHRFAAQFPMGNSKMCTKVVILGQSFISH